MNGFCWWLVEVVSRSLQPGERDVVRGDLAESGETGKQALRGLLGLVLRRQAALWMDWRPWLVLAGLVAPLGILLSLISRRVADGSAIPIWEYTTNWDRAYVTNAGLRLDLFRSFGMTFMAYLALVFWSWSGGFVLGILARRTIAVHGALFCLVLLFAEVLGAAQYHAPWHAAVFSLTFYDVIFPLIVQTVLVLLPSIWGMDRGRWPARLPWPHQAAVLAVTLAVFAALPGLHWIWWQTLGGWQTSLLRLATMVPAGCVAVIAIARWRRGLTANLKENHT
jgi:hypothetical protein